MHAFIRSFCCLLIEGMKKSAGVAAAATYGVGALLILKKHHVDTVILDYVNERGGKMGIVIQMETSQGQPFSDLLKSRGVPLVEPEGLPDSPATKSAVTERNNQ